MGTFGNTNPTLMRHDFKRAFYRVMLSEFNPEEIKEFFSISPLVIEGRTFTLREVFELLWQDRAKVPFAWDCATDNDLEPFLVSKGRSLAAFMNKILWLNNNSSVIPGKVLLSWFYPKLESLFSALDARDLIFPLITMHNENWMPNVTSRRVRKSEDGDWIKSVLIFIHDSTFSERLDWDFDAIAGIQFLAVPGTLGMPHFERHVMVSDTRHVERVIWNEADKAAYAEDTLLIQGQPSGRRMAFSAFCGKAGLNLDKFNPPDLSVTVMDRDYYCPIRKRIVLYQGCAYGAPVYLHSIEHRKIAHMKKDLLKNIVSDFVREDDLRIDALESKHLALLASLKETYDFRYFPVEESMTLNDVGFIKGISAKILKYLLEALLIHGRSAFEYKELKRQFEITLGQKNANFEIRFYRLVEKLETDSPGFRIERTGRGKFRVVTKGAVHFLEGAGKAEGARPEAG
jgi:hypothetical protein